MSFHIPADLIQHVQTAVRINAGLSTYDPLDPTLPSLPPLDALIAGWDPSTPADLRCEHCKGKLLRGRESLLCIYCGEKHDKQEDISPPHHHPISFNSTFAYQWLLQSLDLDQSVISFKFYLHSFTFLFLCVRSNFMCFYVFLNIFVRKLWDRPMKNLGY